MVWQGILGIVFLLGLAWACSEKRATVPWRLVASGIAVQFVIAVLLLRVEPVERAIARLNDLVVAIETAARAGTSFVFGYVGGGTPPFEISHPENAFILAFQGLPIILLVSALSALLFHWRILPAIVRGFAWTLRKTLGLGGAVGFATAANVFVGMIEAPLLIRPYLRDMSRAGLFMVMTAGMATISGNMFVLYATILAPVIPDAAGNLLTASLISAPAAVAVAALMVPGRGKDDLAEVLVAAEDTGSTLEAVIDGTAEGIKLVISVAAILVVAVALVSLANQLLDILPAVGDKPLALQRVLAWGMMPVAWLLGVPWNEALTAGELLGTKVVLNELVAYLGLAALPADTLSAHSQMILTYALCGFANLGSLGILLGGLGAMIPDRRADVVSLGPKALLSGNLASFMTGAVVGIVG